MLCYNNRALQFILYESVSSVLGVWLCVKWGLLFLAAVSDKHAWQLIIIPSNSPPAPFGPFRLSLALFSFFFSYITLSLYITLQSLQFSLLALKRYLAVSGRGGLLSNSFLLVELNFAIRLDLLVFDSCEINSIPSIKGNSPTITVIPFVFSRFSMIFCWFFTAGFCFFGLSWFVFNWIVVIYVNDEFLLISDWSTWDSLEVGMRNFFVAFFEDGNRNVNACL